MRRILTVVDDLRRCWWDLLVFEILLKVLQTAVLTPLFAWMIILSLKTTGRLAVSNTEIISFLLSPLGLLGLFLATAISVTMVYLEQAGIMTIAWETISGNRGTAVPALTNNLRRVPVLFTLGVRQLAILGLWLAPLAAVAAASHLVLLSEYDINYYLVQMPPEFVRARAIAAALLVLAILLLAFFIVRWVFAMQGVLLDGKSPPAALKDSAKLVRGSYLRVGGLVLTCLAITVLLPVMLTWMVSLLDRVLFALAGDNLRLVIPIAVGLLVVHWLAMVAASAGSFSIYVLLITRLYAEANHRLRPADPASKARRTQQKSRATAVSAVLSQAPSRPTRPWHRVFRQSLLSRPARWLLLTAPAILVLLSAGGTYLMTEQLDLQHSVEVTAHRGHSTAAPENTLSAIRKAVESRADFAEIDVQLTADQVVVVIHDADLMRIAGIGRRISQSRYHEIREIDAGSWFSPRFKGERIPTLGQAIAEARGKIRLNIELKFNDDHRALVRKVVEAVCDQGFQSECVITSLDYRGLLEVKRLEPRLQRGFIVAQAIGKITDLDVDFLSVNSAMVDSQLLAAAKQAGKDVHVWTVNDPRQMSAMIDRGVKNIITDEVDAAVALRRQLSELSDAERIILAFRNWMRN